MIFVLASASPARRLTLRNAGIEPHVVVSTIDEPAALAAAGELSAEQQVLVLAEAKARDVAQQFSSGAAARPAASAAPTVVMGCDSMLELDGHIMGKPGDAVTAKERWRAMRGKRGVLHTGHWLIAAPGTVHERHARGVSSTTVHFADLTDAEIDTYVASGEPLNVAGGFTIDGLGGPFISRIEGDHHGVVGLSLPLLRDLLTEVGIQITDLWGTAPPHA